MRNDVDMQRFRLDGRVAVVTGAGSGLGRRFAGVLARAGADVALCARRADRLAETARLLDGTGRRVVCITMDVGDVGSVSAAFDQVVGTLGMPAILVNNAGVNRPTFASEITDDDWNAVLDTNLRGAFFTARAFAARLRSARRPGSIINVASILGLRAQKSVAAYMASKAGLLHLTRALALEWARDGIRVNALVPGYFRTDITTAFLDSTEGRQLVGHIPLRRPGEMDELDGPLLLLAGDAGSFMTGSLLVVDGGHLNSSL